MVRDYFEDYYVKAHAQFRALDANQAQRARELSAAVERIRRAWPEVRVERIEDGPSNSTIAVASPLRLQAQIHLGQLLPQDVTVELYLGQVDRNGDLMEGEPVEMHPEEQHSGNTYSYSASTSIVRSGLHGFTVRVRPNHPDMSVKFIPGLICWADESRIASRAGG
jgi:starch phosphorylase